MGRYYKVSFSEAYRDNEDWVCDIDYTLASPLLGDKKKQTAVELGAVVAHSICVACSSKDEVVSKPPKYFVTSLYGSDLHAEMLRLNNAILEQLKSFIDKQEKDSI